MRRTVVLAIATMLILALAAPAMAGGNKRHNQEAEGFEQYFLTPTCSSAVVPIPGLPACELSDGIETLTISNPGSRTGTFEGTQHFEGTLKLNVETLDFVGDGYLTFTGTVPSCTGDKVGKVVFYNEIVGNFVTGLSVNHQETVKQRRTLPVSASLDLVAMPDIEPGVQGENEITGVYSCNKGHHGGNNGNGHGNGHGHGHGHGRR